MPEKVTEECKQACVNAGITFAHSTKDSVQMFPINVRGMVSEDDLKVPSSDLARHVGAAGKELLAWSVADNHAHIIYESDGCCRYTHGLPDEVLSNRLKEVTHGILGSGNPFIFRRIRKRVREK